MQWYGSEASAGRQAHGEEEEEEEGVGGEVGCWVIAGTWPSPGDSWWRRLLQVSSLLCACSLWRLLRRSSFQCSLSFSLGSSHWNACSQFSLQCSPFLAAGSLSCFKSVSLLPGGVVIVSGIHMFEIVCDVKRLGILIS